MAFTLPPLPYAFDALEPHIDAQTMQIHPDKHHGTYVTNLNAAVEKAPELASWSLDDLVTPFMRMVDDMTPYYQDRIRQLAPQQRKLVEFLSRNERPTIVKEIATRWLRATAAGSRAARYWRSTWSAHPERARPHCSSGPLAIWMGRPISVSWRAIRPPCWTATVSAPRVRRWCR